MYSPRTGLLALLLILAAPLALLGAEMDTGAPAADAPNNSPRVQEQNGVSFTSGGAGKEEQPGLERLQGRYNLRNLRITVATSTGQFTSASEVRIEDKSGKALVSTQPDGPIFLAKLPPGEYTVRATAEGTTQTRKVSVPVNGQAPVTFTWPKSPDPGSRSSTAP